MNKKAKEKWVAALRSGRYKQTTGGLRDIDGYCCLGVLCEISPDKEWNKYGARHFLPKSVRDWAGLKLKDPSVNIKKGKRTLSNLNDSEGYNFKMIAALIEKQL